MPSKANPRAYKLTNIGKTGKKRCVFTPHFLTLFSKCHPETISIFLSVLKRNVKEVGGYVIEFEVSQFGSLLSQITDGLAQKNLSQSLLLRYIEQSARLRDQEMDDMLATLDFGVRKILMDEETRFILPE